MLTCTTKQIIDIEDNETHVRYGTILKDKVTEIYTFYPTGEEIPLSVLRHIVRLLEEF